MSILNGTDLSPLQPNWLPPNCSFKVDDFEQDWTWGDSRPEMIHDRFLMGLITSHAELCGKVYSKPGGWFELVDMECVPEDAPSMLWCKPLEEAFKNTGRHIPKSDRFPKLLEDAGFENCYSQFSNDQEAG
ncbi:hypothetical protein AC578_10697 [Pseudocercospora eumusae]|uniref:Uncharacterized protein n=1 Tax=Pseudocercospora eumusae TaxID=321146 RepID=A0A139HJJ1_9PEZI|nr:hypothetical protein AC578_10697 [Pseudocercospora eumusae]